MGGARYTVLVSIKILKKLSQKMGREEISWEMYEFVVINGKVILKWDLEHRGLESSS
jgi:hypothetical protein